MNPLRTVGDFATEALRTMRKVPGRRAGELITRLLAETGIESPERVLTLYPHQLSGGMLQRVVIATAVAQEPNLIIADEPTSGLDVSTQAEVMKLLTNLQRSRGMSMLFITHNLDLAAAACDRTAVMYAGSVVEEQPSQLLQASPRHPYTSGLLGARTRPDVDLDRLAAIPGRPIAAYEAEPGCAFAPRCPYARSTCREQPPPLTPTVEGSVACFRHEELTLPPRRTDDHLQSPAREYA
jgi:oligopeptide/dipeptide ABC transporter ATP-binding protein